MCEGVPIFANNTKALYGKKTNSHSTAAEALKIKEDNYRKFEYHFWDGSVPMDHYDSEAERILAHIDKRLSTKQAKTLVKTHFATTQQLIDWLRDVPGEYHHIPSIKNARKRDDVLKGIFGMTQKEYDAKKADRNTHLQELYARIKSAPIFHPQPKLSKKEIQLKVDVAFDLFKLPRVLVEFKYLNNTKDWKDAYAYANAYADADAYANANAYAYADADAYANANAYANAYANANAYADADAYAYANAYADAFWIYRWLSCRTARFMFVEHLPKKARVKTGKYKGNPFMPIFDLFEMGLYPTTLVGKKFRIYVPLVDGKKPKII